MPDKITNYKSISIKPLVRFGQPTIAKTRIAIADVLRLLRAGYKLEEVPEQYPQLTLNQAQEALDYTTKILGKEEILSINA